MIISFVVGEYAIYLLEIDYTDKLNKSKVNLKKKS